MTTDRFPLKQLIGGEWVAAASGGTWDLIDPGSERVVQRVPFGGAADARAGVDAAAAAYPAWAAKTAYERAEVLERAAAWIRANVDDLAPITTEESGKPLGDARGEWLSATGYLTWFAGEGIRAYGRTVPARVAGRRISVLPQPLGVVATITAWNFPVYNIVRTWAAALAAGNTVVGRPSEFTPRSAMLLAQALQEGGAPAGVVNVVNGDPEAMGQAFLDDARVRKIAFTGSPRVGRLLMDGASRTLTRLALELGGNAPVIVFPDVPDLGRVAALAARFKARNAGQVCIAPQRYFVHASVAEEFTARVVDAMRDLKVGHGLEDGVQVGPLINARQLGRVEELVASAAADGARVALGGARLQRSGYFYAPTVVTDVTPGSRLYEEEIFGPVLPITTFTTASEVLALANATEYGLAAYLFTADLNTAIAMAERLEFGMVGVNDWMPVSPEAPFGGVKGSGIGRETGSEGIQEYMEQKAVFIGGVELP